MGANGDTVVNYGEVSWHIVPWIKWQQLYAFQKRQVVAQSFDFSHSIIEKTLSKYVTYSRIHTLFGPSQCIQLARCYQAPRGILACVEGGRAPMESDSLQLRGTFSREARNRDTTKQRRDKTEAFALWEAWLCANFLAKGDGAHSFHCDRP